MTLAENIASRKSAMSVIDVAEILQISTRLVYQMAADSKIPSFKLGGTVRFDPQTLSAWVHERTNEVESPVRALVPALTDYPCSEAEDVCADAYQLVGNLTHLIPDAWKWLDNLAAARVIHKGLLPVIILDAKPNE